MYWATVHWTISCFSQRKRKFSSFFMFPIFYDFNVYNFKKFVYEVSDISSIRQSHFEKFFVPLIFSNYIHVRKRKIPEKWKCPTIDIQRHTLPFISDICFLFFNLHYYARMLAYSSRQKPETCYSWYMTECTHLDTGIDQISHICRYQNSIRPKVQTPYLYRDLVWPL